MATQTPERFTCRTTAEWLGRRGVRFADDADEKPPMLVSNPLALNGREHEWTPEDLLVGAIETCLLLTFTAMIEKNQLPVEAYYSEAEGVVERVDESYQLAQVTIRPTVVINDAKQAQRVLSFLDAAQRECLVSKSVSAAVTVIPDVVLSASE